MVRLLLLCLACCMSRPSPELVATGDHDIRGLLVTDHHVYWSEAYEHVDRFGDDDYCDDGRVRRLPIAGGPREELARDPACPGDLVQLAGQLVWSSVEPHGGSWLRTQAAAFRIDHATTRLHALAGELVYGAIGRVMAWSPAWGERTVARYWNKDTHDVELVGGSIAASVGRDPFATVRLFARDGQEQRLAESSRGTFRALAASGHTLYAVHDGYAPDYFCEIVRVADRHVLWRGTQEIDALVVAGGQLYFETWSTIERIAERGGGHRTLVHADELAHLTVRGDYLYWSSGPKIMRLHR